MKRPYAVVLACAAALVAAPAYAELPSKTSPVPLKSAVPAPFQSRMPQKVTTQGGQVMTAQEVVDSFDPSSKTTLPGGTQITIQQLLDRLGRAETTVAAQGGSLRNVKKKAWAVPSTSTKLTAQRQSLAVDLAGLRTTATRSSSSATTARTPADCTASTCYPTEKNNSVEWDKRLGDEDTVAAYTHLTVKSVTPDSFTTTCQATWDNGVFVLKRQQSVLKFIADVKSTKKAPAGWSASAALYTLGQAEPIWRKEGKISATKLDRTFATPKASLKQMIVPAVFVEGDLKATATLTFTPNADGTPPASGVQCTLGLTPRLVANVDGSAHITVGIPDLVELAEGGVKGVVTAVDTAVPTNLSLNLTQDPLALNLRFKSDLDTTFMKGRVYAYYKLHDVCMLGKCLIEDGLGLATYGELDLWEDADGTPYKVNLLDKSASITFTKG